MSEDGRRSFYSGNGPAGDDSGPSREHDAVFQRDDVPGRAVVECSRCRAVTRIETGEAIKRILGLSMWIPGRSYNRRLRCPSCHRRSWVRIRWS